MILETNRNFNNQIWSSFEYFGDFTIYLEKEKEKGKGSYTYTTYWAQYSAAAPWAGPAARLRAKGQAMSKAPLGQASSPQGRDSH